MLGAPAHHSHSLPRLGVVLSTVMRFIFRVKILTVYNAYGLCFFLSQIAKGGNSIAAPLP